MMVTESSSILIHEVCRRPRPENPRPPPRPPLLPRPSSPDPTPAPSSPTSPNFL
ncbi:hypothetical protein K501DRAFT_287015 [Backusella circina FSU 941]|nr:hypothetical protein K501DRAFT_287015 [Backusella circina FSU 941]